jgi:hypothetical protein
LIIMRDEAGLLPRFRWQVGHHWAASGILPRLRQARAGWGPWLPEA